MKYRFDFLSLLRVTVAIEGKEELSSKLAVSQKDTKRLINLQAAHKVGEKLNKSMFLKWPNLD